jgi:hypothetical protein
MEAVLVSSRSGDELIELLLAGQVSPEEEGQAANDLLREVQCGYPAQNLGRLIHSESIKAVANGAFVVSELGAHAAPILDEVDFLLGHPLREARFDALDAALTAASAEHGAILAKAVMLIADADQAVRWKALNFLANSTQDQLTAAVPYLEDRHVADLLTWLASAGSDPASLPEIRSRLRAPDKVTRMFAAAAAARVVGTSRQGLEDAATSDDPDIRHFAADVIKILDLRRQTRAEQEQRRRDQGLQYL